MSTVAALATLFAGSGLTATNSVIAVDTLNQNTTGSSGSVANALTFDDTTIQLNSGTTYDGSAARTVSAKTAAIANAGAALATADQIHTFVTTQTDAMAAGTSGNAATATLSTNSTHVLVTDNENTNEENAITFVEGATKNSSGQVGLESDGDLTYNPSSGTVTATAFAGALTGNASTATALAAAGTIASSGDVVWTVDFSGSNVTAAAAIQADAVDSAEIASGAVDLDHMSANSVDSDQYVDGSIDLVHMSANSVDSDQYVDGSIDNAHLADDAVDSDEIAAGAIDLAHMSVNSIDSDQYVDGSIDTEHIADDAVTSAKLANDITIANDLTVTGDLLVSGDTVTVNTATMSVEDPLIILASGNAADAVDVGFYAKYVDSGTKYAGIFRDASDSDKWKIFATTGNSHAAPTTTVNTTSGFTLGHLELATLETTTLTIPDNAIAVGKIAAGALPSDVTVNNGNWSGTDLSVANGGTGASTLTDGGVLLGSGTGAVTAMAVLADGEMIVGDGTTDPVAESGATLRTSIGVDAAGTDNSTDVTLAGSLDYITISGQEITRNAIVLTTDVSGILPEANLPNASETAEGVVELATAAEVQTGSDNTKAITPLRLAQAKNVVQVIDVSSLHATQLNAVIQHDLGTKALQVTAQYKGAAADYQQVIIDWTTNSDTSGTDSDNHILVQFAAVPDYDITVQIHSKENAATATGITYPTS